MLHGLLKRKLHIQSTENTIVLATLGAFTIHTASIIATLEGVLYAVAEKVQGILQQLVGNHIVGIQHGWCLRFQQQFFPQPGLLFQLCLGTGQAVLLYQCFAHLAQHQAARHSLGCYAHAETLTGTGAVVVLHRFQSYFLQPLPTPCLQLGQHYLAVHQR